MNTTYTKLGAWCGPLFLLIFGIGMVPFANFIPPHLPSANADEIANLYRANAFSIQIGLIVMMLGMALLVPFTGAVYTMLRKLETDSQTLSTSFLVAGIVIVMIIYGVLGVWGAAAYRPERAPEITQALNDIAWIIWVWPTSLLPVYYVPVGLLVLADKRKQPLLPRWYGWYCCWVALLTFPGAFLILFKTGPFAWNGLAAFWIPFLGFPWWFLVTGVVIARSLKRLPKAAELQTSQYPSGQTV